MTEQKIRNSGMLTIPCREEFHRFASNLLTDEDFSTYHPSNASQKAYNAINWTKSHADIYRRNKKDSLCCLTKKEAGLNA